MKKKLIIAFPMFEAVIKEAEQFFEVIHNSTTPLELEELIELTHIHKPFGLMIFVKFKITKEVLERLDPSVKVIATASVGYDHIDIKAAQEKGVVITNTPDVLSEATADQAFLLMLGAAKRLPESMETMKKGWGKPTGFNEYLGHDLRGKNLAIFGMGRIGQALADKGRAFGMKILYCNRKRLSPELEKDATFFKDFESMLPYAEVLSLNAPATIETENIMNKKTFGLMPKGSLFVNVARGSLVDEDALIDALKSGHLFGAGLDVFKNEPHFDQRFLELKNVVLSPHIGSATVETRTSMGMRALENIKALNNGLNPKDTVIE